MKVGYFWAKWVLLFLVIICLFIFFSFYAKKFGATALEINLKEKKFSLNTKQISASSEEIKKRSPEDYYIDSNKGFSFKRLNPKDWLQPQSYKGIEEFLKIKGAVLNEQYRKAMIIGLQTNPFAPMLREVEGIRFTAGQLLSVEITDESTTTLIENVIDNALKSEEFSKMKSEEVLKIKREVRRSLMGFEKMKFSNEFCVSVYDKNRLNGLPVKHSLASFAIVLLSQFGMTVDQLAADSRSVIAGVTMTMEKVLVDGKTQDLRIDRLMLITENKDRYFLVEVGFSPETKSSMQIWSELESTLKSFNVIY